MLDPNNLFFTSDPHLGHAKVIEYCNRPFPNAWLMNKAILDNWNKVVPDYATVFLLGDVSFMGNTQTASLMAQMTGTKILITGNHDKRRLKKEVFRSCFASISSYEEIEVQDNDAPASTQLICLMHYPLLSWNASRRGSWHLHGHRHGTLDHTNVTMGVKRLDVGVDSHGFRPLSYFQIKEIMRTRIYSGEV
jgi:calcineurin-like phosphoesterase family protein